MTLNKTIFQLSLLTAFIFCLASFAEDNAIANPVIKEKMYDSTRPMPKTINPLAASVLEASTKAPKDAVILFDGSNLKSMGWF
jgi:hypothetical protein